MSEKRLSIFNAAKEAESKFDYFIAGLVGTVFAYSVQQYSYPALDWGLGLLEPFSLVLLITCLWVSLKRIECILVLSRVNYALLEASERAEDYHEMMKNPPENMIDVHTGIAISPREIIERLDIYRKRIISQKSLADSEGLRSQRYYRYRTLFLVSGFLILLFAKILGHK